MDKCWKTIFGEGIWKWVCKVSQDSSRARMGWLRNHSVSCWRFQKSSKASVQILGGDSNCGYLGHKRTHQTSWEPSNTRFANKFLHKQIFIIMVYRMKPQATKADPWITCRTKPRLRLVTRHLARKCAICPGILVVRGDDQPEEALSLAWRWTHKSWSIVRCSSMRSLNYFKALPWFWQHLPPLLSV